MKFGGDVYLRQELKSLSGGWFAGQQERDEEKEGCAGPVNLFGTRHRNYEGYGGSKRRAARLMTSLPEIIFFMTTAVRSSFCLVPSEKSITAL